jgi:hypothetical protein
MTILTRLAHLFDGDRDHDHDLLNASNDAFGVQVIEMSLPVSAALPHDLAMLSPEQVHEIGTVLGRRC